MDSELLSVFHDEQYESTFNKYEENYWSVENCDTFATHLSQNLNGILPISPIEEKIPYFDDLHVDHYSNDIIKQENINISDQNQSCIFENFSEICPTIEIVSVDPNVDFDDDDDFVSEGEEQEYTETKNGYKSDNDNHSQITFRSRTDSSSIGDYESHTSDDSDFHNSNDRIDYCNENYVKNEQSIYFKEDDTKISLGKLSDKPNSNIFSKHSNSNGKINLVEKNILVASSDSNGSIEIDTENFDLATFITENNFMEEILSKSLDENQGYDSEEIVDIETVDDCSVKQYSQVDRTLRFGKNSIENNEIKIDTKNIFEKDDVEKDPSWDPSSEKKYKCNNEKAIEKQNNKNHDNKLNKKQTKGPKSSKDASIKKNIRKTIRIDRIKSFATYKSLIGIPHNSYKSPKKEKNDNFLIKFDNQNCPKEMANGDSMKAEIKNLTEENRNEVIQIREDKITICNKKLSVNRNPVVPIKKKLNLEEYYKKRKGENKNIITLPQVGSSSSAVQNNHKISSIEEKPNDDKEIKEKNSSISQSLLIPKNLIIENLLKTRLDPITEAKNKVLRMQEIKKKAAQKRLIDITVSSKVGPVTKILPLEEIVKLSTKNVNYNEINLNNSVNKIEYEEIIIVSVSCNTDIQIPPKFDKIPIKNSSNSLLYNISNTIEKVRSNENLKISNNSLITSIKSVILQKTAKDVQPISDIKITNQNQSEIKNNKVIPVTNKAQIDEHGEDKIIMHLPKNRPKQKTSSIAIQTDSLPEFPPLELIMPTIIKINRNRDYKNRKYRRKKGEYSPLSSSNSDKESDLEVHSSKKRSDRYRSNSRSTCSGSRQMSPSDSYHYSECKSQASSIISEKERERSRRGLRTKNIHRTRNYSGSGHSTSSSCRSRSSSYSDRSRSRSRSRNNDRKMHRRSNRSSYRIYKKTKNKNSQRENSPAVEERRIVYVGRIETETTKEDLKRKFIGYGPIKQITLHYKDTGMKYGFVTFEKAEDAFKAIDNGTTDLKINMYDISFGGRRAFCRQSYADLDSAATNTFQLYSYGSIPNSRNNNNVSNNNDDSFESLLNKVKQKLCATKSSSQKT